MVTEDFLEEVAAMLCSAGREGHFGQREHPGQGCPGRNLIFMPPRSPPCPCAFCHLCPLTSSIPCGLVLGLMSLVFSATLATKASTLLQPELCQPPHLLPHPPPRWLALFLSWALPPSTASCAVRQACVSQETRVKWHLSLEEGYH